MPEGPEIRLAADRLARVLLKQKATRVQFAFGRLHQFEKVLTGRTVTAIETRGKAMLTFFDDEWVIYSHNQLYGRWYIADAGKRPDVTRQLRLTIETQQKAALLYSASDIDVLKKSELKSHPFLAKLGPDILSEQPDTDTLANRLLSPAFANKQLAGLLLDQRFVAGLGTYLCAEILFFAKLHPKAKPSECSDKAVKRLAKTILDITQRSYRTQGITNPPARVRQLKSMGLRDKEEHRFSVYRREGLACYQCGSPVQRSNVGGRPMFHCPACQPLTGSYHD